MSTPHTYFALHFSGGIWCLSTMAGPISATRRLSSRAATATAAFAKREATKAGAPASVLSIPATVRHGPTRLRTPMTPDGQETAGAAIRQVGCTRRVFLLRPHLTIEEIGGLAYRISTLGKNEAINSVLIATSEDDDAASLAFPTSGVDVERTSVPIIDMGEKTGYGRIFHVAGGYDARAVQKADAGPGDLSVLLDGIRDLALASRGTIEYADDRGSEVSARFRVPVLTMPHGLVNDGGYALCMGSYVLATRDTCYRTLNPYRGLAFDPIGMSYVLNHLGEEFDQPSASYPCGMIMALTSYEADASDLMETGLATHFVEAPSKLGTLERSLAELPPWNQQGLRKPDPRLHGPVDSQAEHGPSYVPKDDVNNHLRNLSVANLVQSVAVYDAAGRTEEATPAFEKEAYGEYDDPSLHLGGGREDAFYEDRSSGLVDAAATFDRIFRAGDVADMVEGLREVISNQGESSDVEERECAELAVSLLEDMEAQSPLALKAVHRLLTEGGGRGESFESCMEREKTVQMNLLQGEDFKRWAKSGKCEGDFGNWMHKSIKDVTNDEVEALFQ